MEDGYTAHSPGEVTMRIGGDDAGFFTNAILIVFLGAIATLGISQMGHRMKNVTFTAPATVSVHTATAMSR
jgi:hypothetical protein